MEKSWKGLALELLQFSFIVSPVSLFHRNPCTYYIDVAQGRDQLLARVTVPSVVFHIFSNVTLEMFIQSPTIWLENKLIQIILEAMSEICIKSVEIMHILWISNFTSKNLNDRSCPSQQLRGLDLQALNPLLPLTISGDPESSLLEEWMLSTFSWLHG